MDKKQIEKITKYIFLESNPGKADLAFIFGTRYFRMPVDLAYKLYKEKLIPKILVTGGTNEVSTENEAEKMFFELKKLGVNENDVLVENKSISTLENVLFSKKLIEEKIGFKNINKVLIIVKEHHIRRALMTLNKHFPKSIQFFPVTYNHYGFSKNDWFKDEIGRKKVLSEYEKIKKYLKKGDIEEL